MNQLQERYPDEIRHILSKYPSDFKRSAVMPLLHLVQREKGYVSKADQAEIAGLLGISTTDVASIAGFYTLFHEEQGGRYRIQVCTDLPCALRGAENFLNQVCAELGIKVGETTPDGLFTIEEVKCLAACHRAPMFQLQGVGEISYHENQTIETVRALINELRQRVQKEAA